MAEGRKKPPNAGDARLRRAPRSCAPCCGKLALVVLLVYGALQVLVRTDFFRSRVEAELSRLAGMEMRVGRIRATESLNLRIRDVIGVSKVAGIEARTVAHPLALVPAAGASRCWNRCGWTGWR